MSLASGSKYSSFNAIRKLFPMDFKLKKKKFRIRFTKQNVCCFQSIVTVPTLLLWTDLYEIVTNFISYLFQWEKGRRANASRMEEQILGAIPWEMVDNFLPQVKYCRRRMNFDLGFLNPNKFTTFCKEKNIHLKTKIKRAFAGVYTL